MSRIEQTWTRFPGAPIPQDELAALLPRWVDGDALKLARQVFRRASVDARHRVLEPGELVREGRSFAQKNDVYKRAIREEVGALCDAIEHTTDRRTLEAVDLLVTASCTGFQIPAIDAFVIQRLGLPLGLRRVNLTEHGCSAGAAALGMAHEWLAARPTRRALVVCSELCSLAFQPEDKTGENIISAAIFGDGSAAVLVGGDEAAPSSSPSAGLALSIRDTYREFFPATEHFMGFEVNDGGLKIKLSQDVVPFSRTGLPGVFARMCARWDVPGPHAFETGSLHPGGRRILEILEDDVGVSTAVTASSWETLRRFGNLSSVTVLVALDLTRRTGVPGARPGLGLVSAFGPGFG
ncbi:MAG TPA: type III polyketide synthase, partial [Minicystis sp.]|nr:type III polyketide synthase [Minicystis sp.]